MALAVAAPPAPAAVIGFDDLPAGTVVDDEYAARGVRFGPSPFPGISGAFTTIAKGQARSAPNVAGFAYNLAENFSSSWIRFDEPQAQVRFYACRTGPAGDPARPNVNVVAYDANGTVVANVQSVECDLNGALALVTVTAQNMTFVNVYATGSGWGLDDLEYAQRPSVVTGTASAVTTSGATLNGTVNPNGQATTYRFEYGTTTAYGSQTAQQSAGSANTAQSVNAAVTGLQPGTTYHYRLTATNATGTTNGADQSFTTTGAPPTTPPPGGGGSAPAATQKAKSSTSSRVSPKRDRRRPYKFKTTGLVRFPATFCPPNAPGANCIPLRCPPGTTNASFCSKPTLAQVCSGKIKIVFKAGTKTQSSKTVNLKANCKYSSRATIRKKGRLKASVRFGGNTILAPSRASTKSARAG